MALRARENELRETREELQRSKMLNEALMHELNSVKTATGGLVPGGKSTAAASVKTIAIDRQTSGVDDDPLPGDEALQVVVEPRDPHGRAIRAPGSLEVTALEIGPQGAQTLLSTWEIPNEQLRLTWKSGLLSTGYFVIVPWKTWPATNKLHIVARFTSMDGDSHEAARDVTIRLPKGQPRPLSTQPPPQAEPILPVPRKVETLEGPEIRNKPSQPFSPTSWQRPPDRPPVAILLPPQPLDASGK